MGSENPNQDNSPTQATQWRGRKGSPLPLPSGNVALVRNPGIQHFLRTGNIPNSLKSLIRKATKMDEKGKLDALFESEEELLQLDPNPP